MNTFKHNEYRFGLLSQKDELNIINEKENQELIKRQEMFIKYNQILNEMDKITKIYEVI